MGLVVAAVLVSFLPFDLMTNMAIAAGVWLTDGVVAEAVFRRRATAEERKRDLRERVDTPPS